MSALALGFGLAVAAPAPAAHAAITYTQLTDDGGNVDQSGNGSVALAAGTTFGFYIDSTDGCCGRALAAVVAAFSGQFDLSNWVFDAGFGDGAVATNPPINFLFNGNNNDVDDVLTTFSVLVTSDAVFDFDWRYSSDDEGPAYDPFGYFIVTQDVPEPATLALFGAALAGLGVLRRKRRTA